VSSTVAAIDVIAANDSADEFLGSVVELVCCLRATEHSERGWAVVFDGLFEAARGAIDRFVPGTGLKATGFPNHRLGDSRSAFAFHVHSHLS
jgi:hypothetical protein